MTSRLSGKYLTVDIPFDPKLKPGPCGEVIRVIDYDPLRRVWYAPVDLNNPIALVDEGFLPAISDPRTHQQIVYAIAMTVIERFERYLGRRFRWRLGEMLSLVPHAFDGCNAYFDPDKNAVLFGYFRADPANPGANLPGQTIYTCLSSDIVAHEVAHAIVHRLRPYYRSATNPDVLAWHEAAADLIALFQHFAFREVVEEAIGSSSGRVEMGAFLFDLASEFGSALGRGQALRSAINRAPTPEQFTDSTEPHERGAVFVAAVFDAYLKCFQLAISDLVKIATGGSGVLPPGHLQPELVNRLATEAINTADRFVGMVVGAFNYLPCLDVTFGDVVRSIVTADYTLNPMDGTGFRGILVESLRQRGIVPEGVWSLSEGDVLWPAPLEDLRIEAIPAMVYEIYRSARNLDPSCAPEISGIDSELGDALRAWAKEKANSIGMDPNEKILLLKWDVSFRRSDDRHLRPEIIIQLTQRRRDLEQASPAGSSLPLSSGTTLVARMDGRIERIVAKPLPLKSPDDSSDLARRYHELGSSRLERIMRWLSVVLRDDPLAPWDVNAAVEGLELTNLHFRQVE